MGVTQTMAKKKKVETTPEVVDEVDGIEISPVRTAFGAYEVRLSSGRKFQVPKWSVRKMMDLGESISKILSDVLGLLSRDDEDISIAEIVKLIPQVMLKSADDISEVIEKSLTLKGGKPQITKAQILGDDPADKENLDLDDFPEILEAIIRVNLTEKTVGKWKSLFGKGMASLTGSK